MVFDSIEDNKTEESGDPELDKIYSKYLGRDEKAVTRSGDVNSLHVAKKSKSLDADLISTNSESAYFEEDGSRKGIMHIQHNYVTIQLISFTRI